MTPSQTFSTQFFVVLTRYVTSHYFSQLLLREERHQMSSKIFHINEIYPVEDNIGQNGAVGCKNRNLDSITMVVDD